MQKRCANQPLKILGRIGPSMSWALVSTFVGSIFIAAPLHAASAVDRANQIKEWRSNCTDPDSDMRLAWLEASIESDDLIAQRTCAKLALFDSDVEMRRLGVQMALVMNDRLIVRFSESEELLAALKLAGEDKNKIREAESDFGYTHDAFEGLAGSMTLAPKRVSLNAPSSDWMIIPNSGVESESFQMSLTVIGDSVSGVGTASTPTGRSVTLNTQLDETGVLSGYIAFHGGPKFPATIRLL